MRAWCLRGSRGRSAYSRSYFENLSTSGPCTPLFHPHPSPLTPQRIYDPSMERELDPAHSALETPFESLRTGFD